MKEAKHNFVFEYFSPQTNTMPNFSDGLSFEEIPSQLHGIQLTRRMTPTSFVVYV